MNCKACEEFRIGLVGSQIWSVTRCSLIQISIVKMHEKLDDHKFAYTRWRACHFLQFEQGYICTLLMLCLQVMANCEKAKFLTIMKFLYFVVYNDLSLL